MYQSFWVTGRWSHDKVQVWLLSGETRADNAARAATFSKGIRYNFSEKPFKNALQMKKNHIDPNCPEDTNACRWFCTFHAFHLPPNDETRSETCSNTMRPYQNRSDWILFWPILPHHHWCIQCGHVKSSTAADDWYLKKSFRGLL